MNGMGVQGVREVQIDVLYGERLLNSVPVERIVIFQEHESYWIEILKAHEDMAIIVRERDGFGKVHFIPPFPDLSCSTEEELFQLSTVWDHEIDMNLWYNMQCTVMKFFGTDEYFEDRTFTIQY